MEETVKNPHFPTGKRELLFGLLAWVFSLLAVDFLFYGGLNLAFGLAAMGVSLASWLYLAKGNKITPYSGVLLVLECIALASLMRSDDILVKFTMLCFALVAGNLSLSLLSGKNRYSPKGLTSLLDVPCLIFNLGIGELGNSFGGLNDARKNAGTLGKKNLAVLAGLAIAIPVLGVLIPLLMQADAAFEGLLNLLPKMDFSELIIVLMFGIPAGCVIYTRNTALKHKPKADRPEKQAKTVHSLTATTVLILVSALYLVYLLSQLAYFVGGLSGILPEEYTLAQYARRGFFEMARLAAINLGIIALAVGLAEKKEGKTPLPVKLLCLFIALMTLFFVATASAKMVLYIASFGLTRLRVLTQVVMIFIGITVIYVTMWLFVPRFAYMKAVVITALVIGAAVAWADVDTVVAAYNVRAYQSGTLEDVDIVHLCGLGDGAVPYLQELAEDPDIVVANVAKQELIRRANRSSSGFRDWNIASATAAEILLEYENDGNEEQVFRFDLAPEHVPLADLGWTYEDWRLEELVNFQGTLKELDQQYPLTCVREMDGYYRAAWMGYNTVAMVIFDGEYNILSRELYKTHNTRSMMEAVIREHGTLEWIRGDDPTGHYYDGYSEHVTVDGYWFHIEYDEKGAVIGFEVELI